MSQKHRNKMIAPIIITALIVLYYVGFVCFCLFVGMPPMLMLVFGVVPLLLAGVCIYVLVERIKEIRSGEEDDLSQY